MGQRPTQGSEKPHRRPRAGGDPGSMDSRSPGNDVTFERITMGLRPPRANENQDRHPRAGGGPRPEELDSRLRGNDAVGAIFRRAQRRARNDSVSRGKG